MKELALILDFLNKYFYAIVSAAFGAAVVVTAFNLLYNAYAGDNKKFRKCKSSLKECVKGASVSRFVSELPKEYARQFTFYAKTENVYPSEVFTFVRVKQKVYGKMIYALSSLCFFLYLAAFIFDSSKLSYLLCFVLHLFVIAQCILLIVYLNYKKRVKAQANFSALLSLMDGFFGKEFIYREYARPLSDTECDNAVAEIELLRAAGKEEDLDKIAGVLKSKGLSGARTAEQQRKLNAALNGLLQSVTKSHSR